MTRKLLQHVAFDLLMDMKLQTEREGVTDNISSVCYIEGKWTRPLIRYSS